MDATVRGSRGFGSIMVKKENDTEVEKEMKGKNEQTEDKNETLKGSNNHRQRIKRSRKRLKERLGYLRRDRSFPPSN